MKNKMRTSKKLFAIVLTAIMVLSVCAVLPAMGDEPAPTVTRTIFKDIYPTTTAYPGDVLIVVIEFVAPQNIPNAGVYDNLIDSGDWNTSVRSIIPGESFNFTSPADNPYIFVWWTGDNSLKEDDPVSVKYQLTVPEDAAGVYYFDGNLSTHSVWPPIDIGGDGSVTVGTPEPLSITITSPEDRTYASTCVRLNFTVEPEGTAWIGYSLDGEANETIGSNTTIGGFDSTPPYEHNIVVYANDTEGNMAASNKVFFTVYPGDIDFGGKVWVGDVVALRAAYGSRPGGGNWNMNADLDCNDHIWVGDVVILRDNYSNEYP